MNEKPKKTYYMGNENRRKQTAPRPQKRRNGRKNEKLRRNARIVSAVIIFVLAVTVVQVVRHIRADYFVQGKFPDEVLGVPVHTVLIDEDTEGRPGIKRQIRYIVIHETANPSVTATAAAHSNFLTSGNSGVTSWHYTVDDTEIYHHVPDDEVAWHAGDAGNLWGGNMKGIGIELCVNEGGDFSATCTNAAKLTAWLLYTYDLDIDAVVQHHDCSGKNCPQILRESGNYDAFIAEVELYLDQLKAENADGNTV